jgi:general secretion pathway protein A
MYTAFYGLSEKPFSLTPDPRYLFLAGSHREALAHVLYGVEQGDGFISVTGEVGTGKTTLCWTLLQRLGPDTEVAFVFNPTLSGDELLRAISVEFDLPTEGLGRAELSDQLNRFLLAQRRAGHRVLLIVDEAQNLSRQTLEEIRLLSNLETSTSKLIQILLFGQPELDAKLESRDLRQLRQRISVRWALSSLSPSETREYVRHRLRVASGGECDFFTDRALREVHRRSRGVPRLVNLICDRALLAGFAAGSRTIGPDVAAQAAREVLGTRRPRWIRVGSWLRRWAAPLGAALLVLAFSALVWHRIASRPTQVPLREPAVEGPRATNPPQLPTADAASLREAADEAMEGSG